MPRAAEAVRLRGTRSFATWKNTMTITSMAPGGIGYSSGVRRRASQENLQLRRISQQGGSRGARSHHGAVAVEDGIALPAEWPSPVNISSGCFDSKRGRMVMFGGSSAVVPATWKWNAATGAVKQFVAP